MTSEGIEGHIFLFKNQCFLRYIFCLKSNYEHYEDNIFDKMQYDLKGYTRSYWTTFS